MAQRVFPAVGLGARVRRFSCAVPVMLTSRGSAAFFLGVVPVAISIPAVVHAVTGNRRGSDFLSFWQAGRQVLHGHSPYPLLDALPSVADLSTFEPFVYPVPAAFALIPFGILPFAAASTAWLAVNLGAIVLALRLLNVRDWRCYGAVFLSVPVIGATLLGTFSPLLLLGVAAAWRYRARASRLGPIVAALVVAKLFLWPLWLWLVYTRRFAAAALAAGIGAAATFGAWALIGFQGLHSYPRILSRLTELVGPQSYSPYALLRAEGFGSAVAQGLVLVIAVSVVAWCARAFRSERTDDRSFVVALASALALTPILWPHYLVVLFVPIALVRARFSGLWLLPLLLWLDGNASSDGQPLRIVPLLCMTLAVFVLTLRAAE